MRIAPQKILKLVVETAAGQDNMGMLKTFEELGHSVNSLLSATVTLSCERCFVYKLLPGYLPVSSGYLSVGMMYRLQSAG